MRRPVRMGFFIFSLHHVPEAFYNWSQHCGIFNMRNAIIASLLLIAASSFAGQPTAAITPQPVPAELLEGGRLIIKNAGCTIAPPGSGWTWMQYDKSGQNFVCVH